MKHTAVIFDLDGTLLNTLPDLAGAVNRGLQQMGFAQHTLESYRYFVGEGRELLAFKVLPAENRDTETVSKLISFINREYASTWRQNTRAYPGIPELLDALTGSGIRMAILSNKPDDFTVLMSSELLSKWHFEYVRGASPGMSKKPHPSVALKISGTMNIPPEYFLFLGDSDIDIKTARAAGMFPVGALWGYRTEEELVSAGAEAVIEYPTELLELL